MRLILCVSTDNHGEVEGTSLDGMPAKFTISYHMILSFATGCPSEPPAGFRNDPCLRFQYSSPYPTANTCTNTIHLPLYGFSCDSFENFVYCMSSGVLNSAGFGRV